MAHIKEGFVGAVPFSDNRPTYYDNPKKYTHKWVGKEVVIDFGSDSNIHPRRQRVSIKSVESDRIVFITRNNADIIVNDRDYDEWKNIKAQITTQLVEEVIDMSNKKRLTEAESYGWVVEDWDAQEAYEFACDAFGEEELNRQIVRAIGNEELASCLAYIFRMNDFREWEEYKNGEELDEGCSKKKSKKRKVNESVSDDVIWGSHETYDYWAYKADDDEVVDEAINLGLIEEEDVEEQSFDVEDLRNEIANDEWISFDSDREDLMQNIVPEIEKQCPNGLWLAGDYQRWDGSHGAVAYYEDVEEGVEKLCYPDYDARTELVRGTYGRVYFTESSHDAPMGGTAMYLYTLTDVDKSLEIADKIYPEDDWEHELYEVDSDSKWIKACIDAGVMVPVKL